MNTAADYAWMGPVETLQRWLHDRGLREKPAMLVCAVVGREVIVPVALKVKRKLDNPWMSVALELHNQGGGRVVAAGYPVFAV
jgi:hypothetical protein